MLVKTYIASTLAVLLTYGACGVMGWELFSPGRQKLNKADHARAGRSHFFWFSGYHGGK